MSATEDLDIYWNHRLEQELAGQKHKIQAKVTRPMNYIAIALSMDPPDLDVAKSTLAKVRQSIADM